jgi:hypothetical protein
LAAGAAITSAWARIALARWIAMKHTAWVVIVVVVAVVVAACSSHHAAAPDSTVDGTAPDSGTSALIVQSFDGDIGEGLAACMAGGGHCDRPEMNVAASGTQVVEVTSRNVTIYDHHGTLVSSASLASFIASAGVSAGTKNPIEPHVVYDEFIQRWIITATCAFDCVLVSATSDATGTWAGIYLDNYGNDPSIHLAYDANGVYFSEVQPGTNPDAGVAGVAGVYFAIPSAEMKWVGTFAPAHKNRAANMPIDGMPVTDQNPMKQPPDPAFSITRTCSSNCQNAAAYSFHWIVNTLTWNGPTLTYGPDQIIKTDVGSAQDLWIYNTPIAAVSQLGTATQIRPVESHRVMNGSQHGTHVHSALGSGPCTTTSCGVQGMDSHNLFFWVDLDCTTPSACVVAQTAKVSDPNHHLEFATVGAASNGNIAIVAAAIGTTINPSIWVWTHKATDANNVVSAPITAVAGSQPDTCITDPVSFANAVGVATLRDPVDPTKLWAVHQYANSASPCVWATRVLELAP